MAVNIILFELVVTDLLETKFMLDSPSQLVVKRNPLDVLVVNI